MTKPYCIGSDEWNGLSKLIEELGELQTVCGKIIGSEGSIDHWSGNMKDKFIEEIGDAQAAINFFIDVNFTTDDFVAIIRQSARKYTLYKKWDKEVREKSK